MSKRKFSALIVTAIAVSSVVAVKAQAPRATVAVHNRSSLVTHVVAGAQEIVSAIYARAGVQLVWATPTTRDAPVVPYQPRITILILSDAAASVVRYPQDSLGFTPGSTLRHAWLAYVLGHRISAVSRGYQARPDIVLAAAIAHEIGHMLLSGHHSAEGLMRSTFNQADFRKVAQGHLRFTALEAAEIRARLAPTSAQVRVDSTHDR